EGAPGGGAGDAGGFQGGGEADLGAEAEGARAVGGAGRADRAAEEIGGGVDMRWTPLLLFALACTHTQPPPAPLAVPPENASGPAGLPDAGEGGPVVAEAAGLVDAGAVDGGPADAGGPD